MLLVVDDDDLTIRALKRVFTGSEGASSAHEAREKMTLLRPTVVLLDVNLDGEDGIELLTEIVYKYPQTKVIVFTAKTTTERRRRAFEAGATAYIDKMHISRIREIVTDILSKGPQEGRRSMLH